QTCALPISGVDRSGSFVLRPGGVQSPPRELETPLHLALVVEELSHDRRFGTWRDRVDRLPLARTVLTGRKVGVQQPRTVELQRESSAHRGLPWLRNPQPTHTTVRRLPIVPDRPMLRLVRGSCLTRPTSHPPRIPGPQRFGVCAIGIGTGRPA